MNSLQSRIVSRDDLLQDQRFWGQLYWYYLEARVGDPFGDGLDYFLGVGSQAANEWLDELASLPMGEGCFPEVSVTVPLRNRWRTGVLLSCHPDDFEIHEIIVPPAGGHTVIAVSGGTTWLPGLRWEELLAIADAVSPVTTASNELAILLLFLSVGLTSDTFANEARARLKTCWQRSGLTIRHLDEFLDRLAERQLDGRWDWSEEFGWTYDAEGSPRNPRSRRGQSVVPEVKRFFASLAGTAEPGATPDRDSVT